MLRIFVRLHKAMIEIVKRKFRQGIFVTVSLLVYNTIVPASQGADLPLERIHCRSLAFDLAGVPAFGSTEPYLSVGTLNSAAVLHNSHIDYPAPFNWPKIFINHTHPIRPIPSYISSHVTTCVCWREWRHGTTTRSFCRSPTIYGIANNEGILSFRCIPSHRRRDPSSSCDEASQ